MLIIYITDKKIVNYCYYIEKSCFELFWLHCSITFFPFILCWQMDSSLTGNAACNIILNFQKCASIALHLNWRLIVQSGVKLLTVLIWHTAKWIFKCSARCVLSIFSDAFTRDADSKREITKIVDKDSSSICAWLTTKIDSIILRHKNQSINASEQQHWALVHGAPQLIWLIWVHFLEKVSVSFYLCQSVECKEWSFCI